MKIVFYDPWFYDFSHKLETGPLGLAYLASSLEQNLDIDLDISIEVDVETILKKKPDIVGITSYTQTFPKALKAAQIVKKELNIPVLLGGKHITTLPNHLKECFDVGVIGDGERSMTELIQAYIDKKGFYPEDLVNIQGIVFREGKEFHVTPRRAPLKDLDILPSPDRSILNAYWPKHNKRLYWHQGVFTSRGCPYKCPFCIHSKIQFETRYHSAERIVSDIQEIMEKFPQQKNIYIHDDLFAINKKRLRELVALIDSEKINRKVSFTAMSKPNHFDDETASLMKEMNFKMVAFGFESGDEQTLQYLKGDASQLAENIKAIDNCNKYGIDACGYFILGAPTETKEGLNKTYWFIRQHYPPISIIGPYCMTPFPGTKTWDYALEKGLVNPDTENWEDYHFSIDAAQRRAFINEHYDFDFFKGVYNNYFRDFMIKGKVYAINDDEDSELSYYNEVFNRLGKYNFRYEDNILEIGTNYLQSIKNYFPEKKEICKFDHWIFNSPENKISDYQNEVIGNKHFDLIFFNHSLEQMQAPLAKLAYFNQFLKPGGKVVILVKNPQYLGNLLNLINLTLDSKIASAGFKKYDNLYNLNLKKVRETLKNIELNIIEEIPFNTDTSQYSQFYSDILPLLNRHLDNREFLNNHKIISYAIVAYKKAAD
jgi:anaerobic magnesium-protoporphyrin IX monomethyl ester cyclase